MRTPLLFLLACATAACGADVSARDSLVAAVDTVNGVERLSYPADAASPLAWRFDTLAVIGGAMVDDENYQFQNARLAGNAQGHLFVVDGQGKRILRYDENGSFVQSFGREGGGPGELRFPLSIALGPGDSLWVPDMMNRRITIFDAAGTGSRSIGATTSQGMSTSPVSLAAGHYYQTGLTFMPAAERGDGDPRTPLIRFATDGTPVDTVWRHQPPPFNEVTLQTGNLRMNMRMAQAFAPVFRWAPLSDGRVVVSDSANYVLHIVLPDGTIERTIRRDPPARPTTEEDREAERERIRGQPGPRMAGGPAMDAEEYRRQRIANLTFADVIPRITNLAVDLKDRIWVGISIELPGKTERIDVYDDAGRLLGEIRDPAFFPSLLYGPDLAARLTEDEFDVEQVVVMRVVE